MYAKIENGQVVSYPLSEGDVRAAHPHASLPAELQLYPPAGYVFVERSGMPNESEYKVVIETTPVLVDDTWRQTFALEDRYTADELVAYEANKLELKWNALRSDREAKLVDSEFIVQRHRDQKDAGLPTSISDAEFQLWLKYRQALRDLPNNTTDIDNIIWPARPDELSITLI